MIETNQDRVITMSVMGVVISPSYPGIPAIPHQIDREGKPRLLPALGGIVYNVKVGDQFLVEIIKANKAGRIIKRRPAEGKTATSGGRAFYKQLKKMYLDLKKKYEPET